MNTHPFTTSIDEITAEIIIGDALTENEREALAFEIKPIIEIKPAEAKKTSIKVSFPWSDIGGKNAAIEAIKETRRDIERKLHSIRSFKKKELIESIIEATNSDKIATLLKRQVRAVDRNEEGLPTYLVIVCANNPKETIEYEVGSGLVWFTRAAQINGEDPDSEIPKEAAKILDACADALFTDTEGKEPRNRTLGCDALELWREASGFLINGKLCHALKEGGSENKNPVGISFNEYTGIFSACNEEGMMMFLFEYEELLDGEADGEGRYTFSSRHSEPPITIQPLFTRA